MTHRLIAAALVLLAAAGCLALSPAASVNAAEPSARMDKVDFAKFTCADAAKLKSSDPERFAEAAHWLAGWLAEPKVSNDVSLPAIAKAADGWLAACAATPDAQLRAVAKPAYGKERVIPMSALKCQEFLELDAADHDTAMALIRWIDGWNARALGETTANFYYHKKHMQSAVDGCMKYPRRVLMYVAAGKYR